MSDYVLSNELVSMAISQVAEDREINGVLRELLSEEDNEIYIKDIQNFTTPSTKLSFWEIMKLARKRNEIAVGYCKGVSNDVVLNPKDKSAPIEWNLDDHIVIIAED